jgi:hypothetical protein
VSTTAHQTWVRRAGRYFTDAVPGYTYRIVPALGTAWAVSRQAYGTDAWEPVASYSSLAKAKAATLAAIKEGGN